MESILRKMVYPAKTNVQKQPVLRLFLTVIAELRAEGTGVIGRVA